MNFSKTTFLVGAGAFCLLALIFTQIVLSPKEDLSAFIPPADKYNVKILRDNYGVPHVFGKTDADAAYGLAWANCEDDWVTMEEAALVTQSRLASVKGGIENAAFDFMSQLFRVRKFVNEKYDTELSPDVRKVMEAYAEGITHFAATHRDKMPDVNLPITAKDLIFGATLKSPFFYELHKQFLEVYQGTEQAHPTSQKNETKAAFALPIENPYAPGKEIGSNSFAVAPSRSADGWIRLWVNSHMPWDGQLAWYEAHIHSEEGWNMIGGTFPGGPMILSGHDEAKAWCHTVNRPDLADVYELEMNPDNDNQYKFDGEWKDLETDTAHINLKLWGPISYTVSMPLIWSVHGPCYRTSYGVFAFRFAGYGEVKQFEQWFRMNKAKTFQEFQDAMAANDIPCLNMVYADKEGNLFYAYNGQFPLRSEDYDWFQYLPGNTSDTLWTEFRPWQDIPKVINPPSGFIFSCNNSPYFTTVGEGNPAPENFSKTMGIETVMYNRAHRARELWGQDESITREEFIKYKWDKKYSDESPIVIYLKELFASDIPDEPLLQEAVKLLKTWSPDTEQENKLTMLVILASRPNMPFSKSWPKQEEGVVNRLRAACDYMMEHFGTLEVPWGEVMRLRRGNLDLPLGGGPDTLRVVMGELGKDGKIKANYGDGLVMLVEWDKEGRVHGEAVHNYGGSITDKNSPYYTSQTELFAKEQLRPTLLDEKDIREHLQKEYTPGSDKLWYQLGN